uniref:Cation efflux protein cytoplasmic domain-containing protein n=1 Tax=Kalanchoe fedtschenkoi TaxID=63787 RepID=A0A7N0ULE1_KALFE
MRLGFRLYAGSFSSRIVAPSAFAATHAPSLLLPYSPRFTIPRRWHFGHSNHHHKSPGENIFRIGLAADVCLSAAKAFTGYVSGSTAIIADAAHSISDVVLSGVALWSYKASRVPKDIDHPYGYILELVDASIPAQALDPVKQTILQVSGVKGCHRLRGRRAGSFLYLDVHIEVDPFLSVSAAHCIGESVRGQIHKSYPEVTEVFIHIDPSMLENMSEVANQEESHEKGFQTNDIVLEQKNVEEVVTRIISSRFSKEMSVERITHHRLQGKTLLEIELTMPPHLTIGDAMRLAEEIENEILNAAPHVVQASIHVRLGRLINVTHKSQDRRNVQHSWLSRPQDDSRHYSTAKACQY